MGLKTRLSSYCSKRGDNNVNLVKSRKRNARLACPIVFSVMICTWVKVDEIAKTEHSI